MNEESPDPFGRADKPPKHDWLPPTESTPPAAPPAASPEAPEGWQPPGSGSGGAGWSQSPAAPTYVQPQGAGEGNGKATASLVLGICGVVLCPLICSILALVFGYQARGEIDRTGNGRSSRGSAVAGIVLGWIGTVLAVLGIVLIVILAATGNLDDTTQPEFNNDGFDDFSMLRVVAAAAGRVVLG